MHSSTEMFKALGYRVTFQDASGLSLSRGLSRINYNSSYGFKKSLGFDADYFTPGEILACAEYIKEEGL